METPSTSIRQGPREHCAPAVEGRREPFRLFFLIATTDAMFGAVVWLPLALVNESLSGAGAWHRNALLFGTTPAILAGFLLTALPRWTKQPAASRDTIRFLAATWIAARASSLLSAAAGLTIAAVFVLFLTIVATRAVLACEDRRNVKVVALLWCFCASIASIAATWHVELALRVAVASIVGLIAVIGGRVVPALAAAYAQKKSGKLVMRLSTQIERTSAVVTACALVGWAVAPHALPTGVACATAALCQLLRVAQWRGWQGNVLWSILTLHVGYCWIVVGFMLLAIHVFVPERVGQGAGVHAWTIGAIGMMGLAIMASMIRRHSRRPFSDSPPATAAFISIALACLLRLAAETPIASADLWISLSAGFWIAAFGLFLAAFGGHLLQRE